MKNKKGMGKRLLSLLLTTAMLLSVMPSGVLAVEAGNSDEGLCTHHTEHTAECGYIAEQAEIPCDKACADTDGDGVTDHGEDCVYAPAVEGQPCTYACSICTAQALIDALPESGETTTEALVSLEKENVPQKTNPQETQPGETELEQTEPVETEIEGEPQTYIPDAGDMPGSDELFAGYAWRTLYGESGVATLGNYGETVLEGTELAIYNELKTAIGKIASGESASTALAVITEFNLSWETDKTDNELRAEAAEKLNEVIDTNKIVDCLMADCPYELYWYDKTTGVQTSYGIQTSSDGTTTTASIKNLTLSFAVASAYAGSDNYTADTTKTAAAANAATAAQKVVANNAGKSDYEKLTAYKDYICSAVSYNSDAASNNYTDGYGDPWQLIYVFDGDSNTNVVCEGYAKAFQYLCDLSNLTCYTVTGTMSGGTGAGAHMWNIVTLDGANYLVDVTNSDDGTVGAYGGLFLAGAPDGNADGYTIAIPAHDLGGGSSTVEASVTFSYDAGTKALYSDSIRTLAKADYSEPEPEPAPEDAVVSVTAGGETHYYTNLSEAFGAASSADNEAEVKLLQDIGPTMSDSGNFEVSGGVITFDLNGYTWTEGTMGSQLFLKNCKMTLRDSSVNGTGKIKNTGRNSDGGNAIRIESGASLIVESGSVESTSTGSTGYGINVNGGELTVQGGTFTGTVAGIFLYSGNLNIEAGTISGQNGLFIGFSADKEATLLSGGTYVSGIRISNNATNIAVADLLAPGFGYYYEAANTWANDTAVKELTDTVTVEKAPIQSMSVTADKTSLTYGDAAPTLTAEAELADASAAVTYQWYLGDEPIDGATEAAYIPGSLDAGEYAYACTATADGYSLTSAVVTVNVEQKELELAITGTTTKTYDGTTDGSKDLAIEIKNAVAGDTVTTEAASYTYNSANVAEATTITAGGVTLSGVDAGNYKLPEGPVTTSGTITKSTPVITFLDESVTKTYSGEALNYPFEKYMTVDGASIEDVVFSWKDSEGKILDSAPVNAGTYTIIATIAETKNTAEATNSIQVYILIKTVSDPTIILEKDSYEYDGTEKKPTVKVFDGDTEIDSKEYRVSYSNNTNVGTATVTITDEEGGNYEINESTASFQITKPDLATATVTLDQTSFTYDGTAKEPGVTVVKNERTLEENTDYTVTYTENTNAGTATATVTAKADGNYSGFISKTFEIKQVDISNAVVTLSDTRLEYIGGLEIGVLSVVLNGTTLAYGTDYTYSGHTGKDVGIYTVTVEGKGNYTGTATATWEIYPKELTVSNWTIEKAHDGTDGVVLNAEGAVLYGVCDSDDVKLDASGVTARFADAAVGENKSITYTGSFALNGEDAKNYTLKAQPTLTGTITKRPISVTPDSLTKEYGTDDPMLTYKITSGLLLDGHTLTLARATGDTIGSYAINQYHIADQNGDDVSGNYDVTLADVNFQITQPSLETADVSLTLPDGGYTYDGTAKTPGVTVVKNGRALEEGTDYTVAYSDNVNAGTATLTVTAVENGNYSGSNTVTFVIQKADPVFSVSPDKADKTYGDAAFALVPTHQGDGAVTYASSNEAVATVDETGTVTLLGAGEAAITVTLAQTANYEGSEITVAITVARKNDTLTVEKLTYEVVYGDGDFSIGYETESGSKAAFTSSDPKVVTVDENGKVHIVGVGEATITLQTEQSENYNAVSEKVTVVVAQKVVTVTADDKTKVYGEDDPELTYTATGVVAGDELNIALLCGSVADVGEYDITADLTKANPNYKIEFVPGKLTVTQRTVTLNWGGTSLTYNGKAQHPAAAAGNLIAGDTCTVAVDGAQTNVGSYTATAVGLSNGNYKLPDNVTMEFAIVPKDITVEITPNGGVYDAVTGAEAKLIGVVSGDNVPVTLTYTGTANDGTQVNSIDVPALAGKYTVTASIADSNYNLTGAVTADFVVARADAGLSVSPEKVDKTYGDAGFTLTESHKGSGTVTYASSNEDVATVDGDGNVTLHKAGDAVITVTLAQTDNYAGDEIRVAVKVDKAGDRLTVEKLTYEVSYGDADFIIAANADSGSAVTFTSSNTAVATVDENGKVHIVGAGEAEITLKTAESENYNVVSKTVTVIVQPKEITVTAGNLTKTYGEDDPALTWTTEGLVDGDSLTDITATRKDGEDIGSYPVTATQKTGANPNYKIRFVDGSLSIEQKDISDAVVELGAALIENGETQTQKIQSVTVKNSKGEAMDVTYTVENNTGRDAGAYTMTITGVGNFTGTVTKTFVIAPAADNTGDPEDGTIEIGDGEIGVQVQQESGAPAVSLQTSKAAIIEMLIAEGSLTAEELAQVAEGADIDIILKVTDASASISPESKAQMEKAIDGYVIGQYLDISLYKQMTVDGQSGEWIPVTGVPGGITISVKVPQTLLNTDEAVTRTFWIVRNHEGVVDFLSTTYDGTANTLTFTTDRFGDYAIVYQDTKRTTEDEGDTPDKDDKDSGPLNTATGKTPQTGDDSRLWLWLALIFVSCAGAAGIMFYKRKKKKREK